MLREVGIAEATMRSLAHRELAAVPTEAAPPQEPRAETGPARLSFVDKIADAAAAAVERSQEDWGAVADKHARAAARLVDALGQHTTPEERADVLRRAAQIAAQQDPQRKFGL
jgi:hypothetical protein